MSVVDSSEFKAKAAAYREKAEAMRSAHARRVFDIETADVETVTTPQDFIERLKKG